MVFCSPWFEVVLGGCGQGRSQPQPLACTVQKLKYHRPVSMKQAVGSLGPSLHPASQRWETQPLACYSTYSPEGLSEASLYTLMDGAGLVGWRGAQRPPQSLVWVAE